MASPGVFRHIRNYGSAGMLAALASIISFPILTRSLSVEEYGLLGLITSSLTLYIAVGKLGVQHSVIRFYAQIRSGNIGFSLRQLNSTVSIVFLVFASVTTTIWLFSGLYVLPNFLQSSEISSLFIVAAGVVFVRLLGSGVMNFLRAQQRSGVVAVAQILTRYLYLVLVVALLWFSEVRPQYIIVCLLIAEIAGVAYAARCYGADFNFRANEISGTLARALLVYGVPLMMLESLGLILRLSDRYLIEALLGVNALGMYSASYNLTQNIDFIVLATLVHAIKPIYMQLWEGEGVRATEEFLANGLRVFLVLGFPFLALFSLAGPHLINFLASPKYAPGAVIIPFVAFSFLLEGTVHFLGSGLYIQKNTKALLFWGIVATAINLVLNMITIPVYGIVGAAVVTIVSYAVFMFGVTRQAFQYVPFQIYRKVPAASALLSLAVYALLVRLDFGSDFVTMMAKGIFGAAILSIGLVAIDPTVREWLLARWRLVSGGER